MTVVSTILKLQPSNALIEDDDEKSFYWNMVLQYWKLPNNFRHFPGPNPVSIERQNFDIVKDQDFLVGLKTDGVRFILMLTTKPNSTEPISLMIDRTLNMYEVEIWANEDYFFNGCILDGELVWNTNEDLQYIVFDVVRLKGIDCISMNYRERLQIVHDHVLCVDDKLDNDAVEQMVSEEDKFCARNNQYNLQISPKICVPKQRIKDLWNGRKMCSHRNDGLIFTLNNQYIETGTSSAIYKWKPLHSIDVKCYHVDDEWKLFGNHNTSDEEVDITHTIDNYTTELDKNSKLMNLLEKKQVCVVECLVNIENGTLHLIPERERSDKKAANTIKTIIATIKNAKENIDIHELFNVTDANTVNVEVMDADETSQSQQYKEASNTNDEANVDAADVKTDAFTKADADTDGNAGAKEDAEKDAPADVNPPTKPEPKKRGRKRKVLT